MFAGGANTNCRPHNQILSQLTHMFSNRSRNARVGVERKMRAVLFEAAHGNQHNARGVADISPREIAKGMC
jgi:hypothetical protein